MSAKHPESVPANGTDILIPLNKLKKSPKNAGKVPTVRRRLRPMRRASPPRASCRTSSSSRRWMQIASRPGSIW